MIEMKDACPLRVTGLTKQYPRLRALDDVSLEVRPGEIFALLGPNGAGKTTLISCIAGMARQTSGTISVFGHDTVADFRLTRRLVGLVPQEVNFDPFFTPRECLMIHMGMMGVTPDATWVDELLKTMSLWDQRDAYTRTLSGGMKRRLLVAKALAHRPRLLFLDEPTAGVDVELRKDLWNEVARLRERGTTIILTTHYLEEAERLADRIGVITRGRIALVEERSALMKRYGARRLVIDVEAVPSRSFGALEPRIERVSESRLSVEYSDPAELGEIIEAVRAQATIVDVQLARTSLEDIFVGLVHAAEGRP